MWFLCIKYHVFLQNCLISTFQIRCTASINQITTFVRKKNRHTRANQNGNFFCVLLLLFISIFNHPQMQFMLLFSRQGKLRLQKWYVAHPDKLKKKITRELITTILARKPKMCSFLEWRDLKIVYKR